MTAPYDADVLIVGAGPAGGAAALMAASLRLRVTVVEAERVGGRLQAIGAVENVPGWHTGPGLARALDADLAALREAGRCQVLRARATAVRGYEDRAEVTLADGRALTAPGVVVATGVTPLTAADAPWLTAPAGLVAPPLWRAVPDDVRGAAYVLGADRPLGTWLRSHPGARVTLRVLCPPEDDYKAAEVAGVAGEDRVRLIPVSGVTVLEADASGEAGDSVTANTGEAAEAAVPGAAAWSVDVRDRAGRRTTHTAHTLLTNLGNTPAALPGLARADDGYCPPQAQHPRVRTAGDLRSARYQRILTAQGSGAEAVLGLYYASVLGQG
ncbi:oxidoreductase [Streptomyces sp. G45]|uniref:oxidoreductase n=1 Tax=Streptomyces sp. G45 TaxID=3406627 RepID=UPI003C22BD7C